MLRAFKSPNEKPKIAFGTRLTGIADLNGNGTGEVVIATGRRGDGIYIFDGGTGKLINVIRARGGSLAATADVTGDGVADLVRGGVGSAAIHDGKSGVKWRDLVNPDQEATRLFGWSVAGVHDVDGDGKDDVIVSDWQAGQESGRVHLFSGATGANLRTVDNGRNRPGDQFGRSVAGLQDLDGDGRGDFVVGASGAGLAYILNGADGRVLRTLHPPEDSPTPNFGWAVADVPDLTGDGRMDVLVGGFPKFGTTTNAHVFDGATGAHLAALPGQSDFGGGGSVMGISDLNGDGRGDILLADSYARSGKGQVEAGTVSVFLSRVGPSSEAQTKPRPGDNR